MCPPRSTSAAVTRGAGRTINGTALGSTPPAATCMKVGRVRGMYLLSNVMRSALMSSGTLLQPTPAAATFHTGDWYEDKKHGKGKLTQNSGNTYQGDFSFDRMHGLGTWLFPNGSVYKGRFQNNHCDGQGKMVYLNGTMFCANHPSHFDTCFWIRHLTPFIFCVTFFPSVDGCALLLFSAMLQEIYTREAGNTARKMVR